MWPDLLWKSAVTSGSVIDLTPGRDASLFDRLVKSDPFRIGISCLRRLQIEKQKIVRIKSQVRPVEIDQRPDKELSACQEKHRERDRRMTRVLPVRFRLCRVDVCWLSFSPELTCVRVACNDGAIPKSRPLSMETVTVKVKIDQSKLLFAIGAMQWIADEELRCVPHSPGSGRRDHQRTITEGFR